VSSRLTSSLAQLGKAMSKDKPQRVFTDNELRPLATRMGNADLDFLEEVKRRTGCTDKEASKVYRVYLKHKVMKRESGTGGRWIVKHGAFWDADVLQRAITEKE